MMKRRRKERMRKDKRTEGKKEVREGGMKGWKKEVKEQSRKRN